MEIPKRYVKSVQSLLQKHQNDITRLDLDLVLHLQFQVFHHQIWTNVNLEKHVVLIKCFKAKTNCVILVWSYVLYKILNLN